METGLCLQAEGLWLLPNKDSCESMIILFKRAAQKLKEWDQSRFDIIRMRRQIMIVLSPMEILYFHEGRENEMDISKRADAR